MATYHFLEARQCVLEQILAARGVPGVEKVSLADAAGRVLAEPVCADRDYPPLARSIRDGFAVRASGFTGSARVVGEVRAGEQFRGEVGEGEAVEIMTGAPVPDGADAVIMVEHVERSGDRITTTRKVSPGDFINPRGSEAARGAVILPRGKRIGFAEIAALAMTGVTEVPVYLKPRVAILATGDEIVPVEAVPHEYQIRNSNACSLAVQVQNAGGEPVILPVAPDEFEATRKLIEQGLTFDLLLLSGGVSAGKYDIVERVLLSLGAKFYFDRVLIQPGQPLVFGRVQGRFFFGLPGNPASTMVTFEIFAKAAVELLGGQCSVNLPILYTRLATDFRHKPGLTRFLPARLSEDGTQLAPVPWQGSSDVVAIANANAWLVAKADQEEYRAGDWIQVLIR
ncbi:MAG: molybdopterin molybdotransferase MoeA [Bryobacteraceae bacterium]|nr:molybdopterin molybdotransferase MoeA [Bryobacteraceae bacterium]